MHLLLILLALAVLPVAPFIARAQDGGLTASPAAEPAPTEAIPAQPTETTVAVPEVTGQGVVTGTGGDGVNCRVAPDPAAAPITVVAEGTTVDLTGPPSGEWQPVLCAGQAGYISTRFLQPAAQDGLDTEPPADVAAPDPASLVPGRSLSLPLRAAFYYPWFPGAWSQKGIYPYTNFTPSRGYYDGGDPAILAGHIADMQYGNVQAGIASWWGQGTREDSRMPQLLSAATNTDFTWTVYYEDEGFGNPSVSTLQSDLQYLRELYASHPNYLRIDGRFVVFAYGGRESCEMVDRWTQANTVDAYIVLKVFGGYENCANQPDGWHQYAPALAADSQGTFSYSISPGFHLYGEDVRLERDLARWQQDVQAMVASGADWQLVTTFNEWGEGTSVESATEWESPSGYGQYLDVLHTNGQGALASPAFTLNSDLQGLANPPPRTEVRTRRTR
jgi:hypothetical protein